VALPNFILIGVPKAGTTSLEEYLCQHPDVFVAWEPRFLHFAGQQIDPGAEERRSFRITSLAAYEALFSEHTQCKALGDDSPSYLMYPEPSIAGIRRYTPEAKFIAIYRHPADRGYSEYLMNAKQGQEPFAKYAEAIRAERAGRPRDDGRRRQYFQRGFYTAPTKKFLEAFPRERFLFLLYDDLLRDPAALMKSVFRFLGVDPEFVPDTRKRFRVSRWPKYYRLHHFLNSKRSPVNRHEKVFPRRIRDAVVARVNAANLKKPPPLDAGLRRELTLQYREDILELQTVIGKDLSGWLEDAPAAGGDRR
jgi:hypothetical protein